MIINDNNYDDNNNNNDNYNKNMHNIVWRKIWRTWNWLKVINNVYALHHLSVHASTQATWQITNALDGTVSMISVFGNNLCTIWGIYTLSVFGQLPVQYNRFDSQLTIRSAPNNAIRDHTELPIYTMYRNYNWRFLHTVKVWRTVFF